MAGYVIINHNYVAPEMSNIKDNLIFADFGLNTDDSYRYINKGDSPYNLNVLKGEDGSSGELTNLKGNVKVTYELGDSNTYFVAWSCYDPLTRNVYFYIFSQPYDVTGSGDYEYDNRFVRFNEDSEVITTMFYDTKNYFGVDPALRVKDSFVLGDWLFYNPQTSEPKIISLTKIYNYTTYDAYDETETYTYGENKTYFGGLFRADEAIAVGEDPVTYSDKWTRIGDSYQDATDIEFDSEFRYAFNLIKHIPVYRPVCIYGTDEDKNANNVRGKLFRFSHRYKFFDNSYSRYSAYSDITLPQYDEYYNGEVTGDLDQYNCIDVSIPLHSAALVKEIDIIFQETGGDWKRAKIINRQDIVLLDQVVYTYRFYNTDSAYDAIDDTELTEPYDAVPREANSMEIINKNILTFGGCKEGFDNLDKNDIDVLLTPEIEEIEVTLDQTSVRNLQSADVLVDYNYLTDQWITSIDIGSWYPGTLAEDDVFVIYINGQQRKYTVLAGDLVHLDNMMTSLLNFLNTNFPTQDWVRDGNYLKSYQWLSVAECSFYTTGAVSSGTLTKARGFKTGAWHPFCIFYYDEAMRRRDAQTSKDHEDGTVAWSAEGTTVYVPMLGEYSPVPTETNYKWNINWEVNHLPPSGAKWWRWGYAGNALCSQFVQYIIEDIGDVGATSTTEPILTTWIDISPLQTLKSPETDSWNRFPNSIIDPWSWVRGDRVRFITEKSSGSDMGAVIEGVYDYEILGENIELNRIYIQLIGHAALDIDEDTLVEIYRPIKSDTAKFFYEFGELMPIIQDEDDVYVHGAGKIGEQNQSSIVDMFGADVPAKGVFTAGDVYHILRTPSKPIHGTGRWFHESQWFSDFYSSDDWDKGRTGVETQFGERFLNIVRFSDQYLQNTLINGLSTFRGSNYKELNDIFGDILRIIEIGDTLKVYQRKKPSSILIGRTEYYDAEGNANIQATSDRVLGSIRYSTTNYGTEFPESITRNNRYVYGFDIYNGVIWRDADNGIFPISGRYASADGSDNYKMETYFKEKAKALLESGIGGVSVETVWDERHGNLYVVFKDIVNEANDEAIMFHEPSNRWICFTNMDQTPADGWNQMIELEWSVLTGFDGGIGYSFDEDTRFAVFNVVTPTNEATFPAKQDLTMTLYDPTFEIDCDEDADLMLLAMTQPAPTIFISWVLISIDNFEWDHDEYGATYKQAAGFTCTPLPDYGRITAKPEWITAQSSLSGAILSINSVVYTGDELYLYPASANLYGDRTGVLTITDDYGNTDSITLTQTEDDTPTVQPTLTVGTTGASTELTVADNGSSVNLGASFISLLFTPSHPDYTYGQGYDINYIVTRNSVQLQTGVIPSTDVSEGAISAYIIDISPEQAASGDAFSVWLSAPRLAVAPTNASFSATLMTATLALQEPTILLSTILYSDDDLDWLSSEFGIADAKTTTVTCGDAVQTRLQSAPDWIAVLNASGQNMRDAGVYVADGEALTLYPDSDVANSGSERSGEPVVLVNEYGDTDNIVVVWGAGATAVLPVMEISYNDQWDLEFRVNDFTPSNVAWVNIATNVVYLQTGFWMPTKSFTGDIFDVYWIAYKKDANGYYTIGMGGGGTSKITVESNISISTSILLNSTVLATDEIIIYFAGNQL